MAKLVLIRYEHATDENDSLYVYFDGSPSKKDLRSAQKKCARKHIQVEPDGHGVYHEEPYKDQDKIAKKAGLQRWCFGSACG